MCLVFGNLQIHFLSEVITTFGFERDCNTILVSDVDMFHTMSFLISLSSWTLKIAQWALEINVQSVMTAVKSVHLIFTTAMWDFWQISMSHNNGSGTIEKLDPENMG